jgi:hypothetical protein
MKKFIKHPVLPWLLVILLVSLLIIKSITPTSRPITPPVDNRIDSLSHIVDSLNKSYVKLKQDYDSAQANVKTEIQYIQIQNAKDISNIHNFTIDQRDSMWSTLNP